MGEEDDPRILHLINDLGVVLEQALTKSHKQEEVSQ
jgi:hypothetical protein